MRHFFILCLLLSFQAFSQKEPVFKSLQGTAQGTTFSITYGDTQRRDFTAEIDSLFKFIDRSMSLWDKNSLITKINENRPYYTLDPHFITVFDRGMEISKLSGGYFDITVGPLVKAWGFGAKKGLPHPDKAQIDSMKNFVGYQKIKRKDQKIIKSKPEMQIDFNAIAQGYTVDVMAEFLNSKNIKNYLVEIGGEVRAQGTNAEKKNWRVGIEKPGKAEDEETDMQIVVSLNGQSLGTSGSYRKFFVRDGKKYSHSIDPFTGEPVSHSVLSITVLTKDCISADAFAKALLVVGLDKAKKMAQKLNIDFYSIYEENGVLKTYATKGFQKIISE
jgi:thiamine biosynthesis lipoprotein